MAFETVVARVTFDALFSIFSLPLGVGIEGWINIIYKNYFRIKRFDKKKKEIINSFYAIVRSKDLFIYFFFFILMLFRRSFSVLFSLKDLIMLYKNIMGIKRGII